MLCYLCALEKKGIRDNLIVLYSRSIGFIGSLGRDKFMYCCLAQLKTSKKILWDHEIVWLMETVKLQLDPTDNFIALNSQMLLFTTLETYWEVKDKLSYI